MMQSSLSIRYGDLSDPSAAEQRAIALAELLRDFVPSTVLTWDSPASVVLGHVVARELGAVSVRCFDSDGLIEADGAFANDESVALVVVAFERIERLRALLALAEKHEKNVVVVGTLAPQAATVQEELKRRGLRLVSIAPHGIDDE